MLHERQRWISCAAVLVALLVPCGDVLANATPATANIIEITATSGGGYSDTFEEVFPVGSVIDTEYTWELETPIMLSDQGRDLAYVEKLAVTFYADPQVIVGFDTTNSSTTDEVYISIRSARIIFDEIPNAQARAWAQVSVTDRGGAAGAYVDNAGTFPLKKLYQARYSTNPIVPTNNVFASLVSEFQTDFGQTSEERLPASGYSSLGVGVYMMEAQFEFILSAGDRADGLSNFEITPEPTMPAVLSCGGLFMLRRRRAIC